VRLVAFVAAALALAGCAGAGENPPAASTPPAGPAPAAPPAAQPQPGVPAPAPPAPAPASQPAKAAAQAPPAGDVAVVWVTRDRGADVLVEATAPAGLTALQALDRVADVETRFGGRFVQAIEGLEGSIADRRDWFFMLNGIEPDVGAAEVELRPGDVLWWDYRTWRDAAGHPAVRVGAFPEPLARGWPGGVRRVEVRGPAELADAVGALADLLGRDGEGPPHVFELAVTDDDGARLTASIRGGDRGPVTFRLAGGLEAVRAAALALARDPTLVRFRYEARFDARGELLP
jgi:hypothetical protein